MKIKFGLLCMAMFATVVIVNAQGGGGMRRTPEERSKRVVDTITTVLKLDQAQQTSAQTAFIDYYKESDKLREAMQAGTPLDRTQFEKLTTDRDEKLKKVLSADQFKKFKDDLEPALRPRRQGGGGNN
ncbi:MAG: hypothetical protein ABIN89_06045 [Chitinophagaceae bacterium]